MYTHSWPLTFLIPHKIWKNLNENVDMISPRYQRGKDFIVKMRDIRLRHLEMYRAGKERSIPDKTSRLNCAMKRGSRESREQCCQEKKQEKEEQGKNQEPKSTWPKCVYRKIKYGERK